jgi:hypothetical protein
MLIGNDRDQPPGNRQPYALAHQRTIAIVLRMHGHCHVGQHRLRPCGRDLDQAAVVLERVAQVPEFALNFAGFDLQVGDGGPEPWIPIDQALVAIEQAVAVELDEDLDHGAAEAVVHGEALVLPIAGSTEPAQLPRNLPPALLLPLPNAADELLPAEIGTLDAFCFQVALDHHLRRDAGMIHAHDPQRVLALQPRMRIRMSCSVLSSAWPI